MPTASPSRQAMTGHGLRPIECLIDQPDSPSTVRGPSASRRVELAEVPGTSSGFEGEHEAFLCHLIASQFDDEVG